MHGIEGSCIHAGEWIGQPGFSDSPQSCCRPFRVRKGHWTARHWDYDAAILLSSIVQTELRPSNSRRVTLLLMRYDGMYVSIFMSVWWVIPGLLAGAHRGLSHRLVVCVMPSLPALCFCAANARRQPQHTSHIHTCMVSYPFMMMYNVWRVDICVCCVSCMDGLRYI
jgi:hypothetical protein